MEKRKMLISISDENYKLVKALSLKTGTTMSDFIEHCIMKYLEKANPSKIEQLKKFFEK